MKLSLLIDLIELNAGKFWMWAFSPFFFKSMVNAECLSLITCVLLTLRYFEKYSIKLWECYPRFLINGHIWPFQISLCWIGGILTIVLLYNNIAINQDQRRIICSNLIKPGPFISLSVCFCSSWVPKKSNSETKVLILITLNLYELFYGTN